MQCAASTLVLMGIDIIYINTHTCNLKVLQIEGFSHRHAPFYPFATNSGTKIKSPRQAPNYNSCKLFSAASFHIKVDYSQCPCN